MNNLSKSRAGSFLVTLLWLVAFIGAVEIFIEDYLTGLVGYVMSPSAKLMWQTVPVFAALLQVVPMLIMLTTGRKMARFTWSRQGLRRWAMERLQNPRVWVLVGAMAIDALYDATFRTSIASTPGEFAWALAESLVVFTLGSEVLLSYAFTNLVERMAVGIVPLTTWLQRWLREKYELGLARAEARERDRVGAHANGRRYAHAVDDPEGYEYQGPPLFESRGLK